MSESNENNDSLINTLKFWQTQEFLEYKEDFRTGIVVPAMDAYQNVPDQLTELKREYIFQNFNQNVRMIGLGIGTLMVGLLSKKLGNNLLKVTRNAAFTYIGAGAFFVPEVFNPFVNASYIDCEECNPPPAVRKQ
ncbi:hypothetical protein PPERSA_08907 [Pseudocohnilembus persalinus]|uniref:Uncharacterized protein n=1 Tax=Pseudocohnilembus persalinus TaxID=266149 RepID=A0A0V0R2R5_PSEPJ|nr:hypothetical protein PPERSA_08907 [Pseudocohnilembus persalinus]|eukprot:KRX08803.1 hypothetical protein PPERSA_08907 [Pseudocohnilembus persalinus]